MLTRIPAPGSPVPAIPGKKGELHYPAGLAPPSFLSSLCTWPEGRAEPGRHSPAFSFLVSEQGYIFFLPLLPPPPPPAPPSLVPFPPSLPPFLAGCPRPGARTPSAARTRGTRGRSRLSGASSLPSPSLPPSPTPDPARSGGQRNPEVSIPSVSPPPLGSHRSWRTDSGTWEEGCVPCACL